MDKKDVIENKSKYSLDEIKAKLSVICYEKKVNFNSDNSDNFDFPYLKDRAKILGVDLDLGMDGSTVKFLRRGYANAASFKGLLHIDLYLVMRRYMSLDRYTLERVYLELFGEEKIDVPGERIYQFWDNGGEELKNLFKYSLDDVVATLKIADQILPLNLELTRFAGQPFFDVSRMSTGQQAEWFLVRKAYERSKIEPIVSPRIKESDNELVNNLDIDHKLSETYDMSTMLIITDPKGKEMNFVEPQSVTRGQTVLR